MKREFDLRRKLLIFFEEKSGSEAVQLPAIAGYDERVIKHHLVLMFDAGLLRCEPVRSSTSDRVIYVIPFELTWDGHEFLDKIRDESIWRKIVEHIRASGGSLAFSVINSVATKMALDLVKNVT